MACSSWAVTKGGLIRRYPGVSRVTDAAELVSTYLRVGSLRLPWDAYRKTRCGGAASGLIVLMSAERYLGVEG